MIITMDKESSGQSKRFGAHVGGQCVDSCHKFDPLEHPVPQPHRGLF